MVRTFAGNGETIELAGETDREVADVDHLLNLAETLRHDLAYLDGDELAERGLGGAQLFSENPNELSTSGCRERSPHQERPLRALDCFGDAIGICVPDVSNGLAGQRRAHDALAALIVIAVNSEALEN